MSTELLKKITGQLADLEGSPINQFPFGITVELTTIDNPSPPSPGGWIGQAPVKINGSFDLFTAYDIGPSENVSFQIFKDGQPIVNGNVTVISNEADIQLSEEEYQSLQQPYMFGYAVFKGTVSFGSDNIAAVPLITDQVSIEIHKTLFRSDAILASTSIGTNGEYCMKLPLNMLGLQNVNGTVCCCDDKLSQVYLSLTINGTIKERSENIDVAEECMEVDLHTDQLINIAFFKTELDYVSANITEITGLDPLDFYTISTTELGSELDAIISQSNINEELISNVVFASRTSHTLNIAVNHSYILTKRLGTDYNLWTNLSLIEVTDYIAKGITGRIIPLGGNVNDTYTKLSQLKDDNLYNETTFNGDTMGDVIGAIISDTGDVKTFLRLSTDLKDLGADDFWNQVALELPDHVNELKMGMQILSLNGMQPEITSNIMNELRDDGAAVSSLTLKYVEDWKNLIDRVSFDNGKLCVPNYIQKKAIDDDTNPIDDYANLIYDLTGDAFATVVISNQLSRDTAFANKFDGNADSIRSFLISHNEDFDFRFNNVWDIDTEQWPEVTSYRDSLLPVQNLMRIAPDKPYAVTEMIKADIKSSFDIANMDQVSFVESYAPYLGGLEKASSVYATAQQTSNVSVGTYVSNNASTINTPTEAIQTASQAVLYELFNNPPGNSQTPDLKTLFGSMDMCNCSDCMSMYSPAAYFADIITFIKKKLLISGAAKPFIELTRRRPDLTEIDLSCKNANVALPYVDLVNELLEMKIWQFFKNLALPFKSYQTNGKAAELNAFPEHTIKITTAPPNTFSYVTATQYQEVYDSVLKWIIFPNKDPLNLALEESRTYFTHLTYERYSLMQQFKPKNYAVLSADVNEISEYNAYAEWLGLSKFSADIICSDIDASNYSNINAANKLGQSLPYHVPDLWNFYGFAAETYPSATIKWYNYLTNKTITLNLPVSNNVTSNPSNGLRTLLERTGISYKELLQVLSTDLVNNITTNPAFVIISTILQQDTCDLGSLELKYTGSALNGDNAKIKFFDLLYRFIKLQRATGWSIYQLDTVLRSLDVQVNYSNPILTNPLTVTIFKQVGNIHKLSKTLNVAPEKIATYWSDMSTVSYVNYDSDNQDPLPSLYDSLFNNKSVLNPPDSAFTNPGALPSSYVGHAGTIIAALNITEAEMISLFNFVNAATPANLTALDLTRLSIVYGLTVVSRGLNISIDYFLRICKLFNLSGSIGGSNQSMIDFINIIVRNYNVVSLLPFSLEEIEYLFENQDPFGYFIPQDETIQIFYENLRTELKKQSDSNLSPADIASSLGNIVIRRFSTQLNIEGESAQYLLNAVLKFNPSTFLYDYLISPAFINSPLEHILPVLFPTLYSEYRKASKIALIIGRLKLSEGELEASQQNSINSTFSFPLFADLPVAAYSVNYNPEPLFTRFVHLAGWIQNRDQLNLRSSELTELWNAVLLVTPLSNTFISKLVELTGWKVLSVNFLIGAGVGNNILGVTTTDASDYQNSDLLSQVSIIIQSTSVIGLAPVVVYSALLANLTLANSLPVRQAAKAKHDDASWLKVAKPLQDVLREKQRQALVGYMVVHPDIGDTNTNSTLRWKDENGLFAYYLIDVEMHPCMMTSRLKQAISTVQLFMDRLIMNLENTGGITTSHLIISPDKIEQWESWRKWYRVWEANRKIFLYPENWIEPELRDDKTTFFKDLETQLLQDEVTDDRADDAIRYYLEQLDEVARLEPVTAFHQQETGIDIKHVFGRTNKEPYRYFYRRLQNREWTPWEKVNVDIKSNHVIPLMWNGRLSLFWFTFSKKKSNKLIDDTRANNYVRLILNKKGTSYFMMDIEGNPNNPNADVNNGNDLKFCWDLKLNWSQYKDGKWQATEVCDDVVNLFMGNYCLNEKEINSYSQGMSTGKLANLVNQETKGGTYDMAEFFKSRTQISITVNKTGFSVDLIFFGGYNENGVSIVTFLFPDGNAKPYVTRQGDTGSQILSPIGTYANNMKFIRPNDKTDSSVSGSLAIESVRTFNDFYFSFIMNWYYTNTDPANPNPLKKLRFPHLGYNPDKAPIYLLKNTLTGFSPVESPFNSSAFRLTKFGSTDSNTMNGIVDKLFWGGYTGINIFYNSTVSYNNITSCINDYFFYEDNKNTFYVEKFESKIKTAKVLMAAKATLTSVEETFNNNYTPLPTAYANKNSVPVNISADSATQIQTTTYYFQTFYHAQIHKFQSALNRGGVPQLLQLLNQNQNDDILFGPLNSGNYKPTSWVNSEYPKSNVQFKFTDPYGIYNWELFFHTPMIIAQRLSDNQQFEDAQKWYHYIFNPTSTVGLDGTTPISGKKRFWKFYPFYLEATNDPQTLTQLLADIANNVTGPDSATAQVAKWEANPFQPHVIARMRKLAYMKNVLMKYIDNLLNWGDQLFSRDTIESINEASQLYIMAANILGKRPEVIPARVKKTYYTYSELENAVISGSAGFDSFSNAMINIEAFFTPNAGTPLIPGPTLAPLGKPFYGKTMYFCLPANDKLFAYWDRVADRLFKIRNCMNIAGVVRQLPLFEPPIDPALLARATALGVDINSILNNISSGASLVSNYRFSYMLQKANEFCSEVKGLGGAILSALEKKDSEQLSLLRSSQEMKMLDKMTFIKESQVNEAQAALDALNLTKENTQLRYEYYSTRLFMNPGEQQQLQSIQTGLILQTVQGGLQTTASSMSAIPAFHIQGLASGTSSDVGDVLYRTLNAISSSIGIAAAINSAKGSMAGTLGSYERRNDDWVFQTDTASKELEQLDQQILGAQIRLNIANRELENHNLQIDNTKAVDSFMRSKFSNFDLYSWMSNQLATTYFQGYQLAYELSKKAEQCYVNELPAKGSSRGFITFGYWDSLRKGLLSGERLQSDLKKMESTYMNENRRELELSKNFSLAIMDPEQLLQLRTTGSCNFNLDEIWYNLDFPAHYMRRIKSVSISMPCVAGPYTSVNATLALTGNSIQLLPTDPPANYITIVPVTTAIATSSAQNDAGIFELNFRDERYIPFENAGAISSWSLKMMSEVGLRQFDYNTISDVIVHVRYTAINDTGGGKEAATMTKLNLLLNSSVTGIILPRYFSLKHEFSNQWYKGFDQTVPAESQPGKGRLFVLDIDRSQFPEYSKGKIITIQHTDFVIQPQKALPNETYYVAYYNNGGTTVGTAVALINNQATEVGTAISFSVSETNEPFKFLLYKKVGSTITLVNESELVDLFFIIKYKLG